MSTIETGSILILIGVGLALTYFGYEAAQSLLRYGGMAAGGAIGGWLGFAVLPRMAGESLTSSELLGGAVVLCLIGAVIGRTFVPKLGRLAVGCLGFTLTAIAALVIFSRGQSMEIVTQTLPRAVEEGNPELFADRFTDLEFVGGISPDIALVGILLVAALGGSLALAHKELILACGVTVIGALLLAVTVPLLFTGMTLEEEVAATFSEFWFMLFLVTGLVFEFLRYSDELDPGDLLKLVK